MAEYGEWNRKGATLSDVMAQTEYGVNRDFIVKGIRAGKLEYRDEAIWSNPYLRAGYVRTCKGQDLMRRILENQATTSYMLPKLREFLESYRRATL